MTALRIVYKFQVNTIFAEEMILEKPGFMIALYENYAFAAFTVDRS